MLTASELMRRPDAIVLDCRFSLADPGAGEQAWREGHIPGAHYLHLERDLSGPVATHGGRHPLPDPAALATRLAALGIGRDSEVVVYDDQRFAFAARCWWLLRALGYRPPALLDGGYAAWLAAGGAVESAAAASADTATRACAVPAVEDYRGVCDREQLIALQAQSATLVDAREERRYLGLEEPIDPVAGHIPGALNRPWQAVTDAAGFLRSDAELRAHFGELLERKPLVAYCGSGVTACVNLYALDRLGRGDALLYPGSWSDWCSYLDSEGGG
ncbi:sulfurtransferase [Haliea atlantica]|nr:sulfurtransferase [Haliea sp.]